MVLETEFGYDLSCLIDDLRFRYSWHGIDGQGNGGICQDSVPQAIMCALQATDFEDAIRNAVSIGGDSDTIACIAGAIAKAMFGIPKRIVASAISFLPDDIADIVDTFETKFGTKIIE